MVNLSIKISPSTKTSILPRTYGQIKLANFINIPEKEFQQYIHRVEKNPLFKKLMYPQQSEERVITYKRFPYTNFSRNFLQLKEEITPSGGAPDIEPLLAGKDRLIDKIKELGIDKFKRYFLYNESPIGTDKLAQICGLSPDETRQIIDLVDKISLINEFSHPASSQFSRDYVKIASVEKTKSGEFAINYFSLSYARGRYVINYKRLYQLMDKGKFTKQELRSIDRLIKQLELINARKTMLYKAVKTILEIQKDYFTKGNTKDLKVLTQRMLARKLGMNPGTLSRIIGYKVIETPWGEQKQLKFFCPNQKRIIKELLSEIVNSRAYPLSDEAIKRIFQDKYKIIISRRSICQYRRELCVPIV